MTLGAVTELNSMISSLPSPSNIILFFSVTAISFSCGGTVLAINAVASQKASLATLTAFATCVFALIAYG
jgi:hypothetical protein